MVDSGLDPAGGGLQIKEGAAAGGTGNELGFGEPQATSLQDVETQIQNFSGRKGRGDADPVADAVAKERTQRDRAFNPNRLLRVCAVEEKEDWAGTALPLQGARQKPVSGNRRRVRDCE